MSTSLPRFFLVVWPLLGLLFAAPIQAQNLPRGEDVIEVPAIGEGLYLHNLFQTNGVIQRDKPIRVWGWAPSGETVTVSFAGETRTATAGDDGKWLVELPAKPANSEGQALTVKGANKTLTLENVLIGDVWVLGGQSNMEHPLSRVENGDLEIISAKFDEIRILTVPAANGAELLPNFERLHEWSSWWKRHAPKGNWDVCSPEIARELSAIGYAFARRLHMTSQVPIGVIDASRGGTTVETWTPDAVLRQIDTPEVSSLLATWDAKVAAFDPRADLEARQERHRSWVENQTKQGKEIPADRKLPTEPNPGPAADQNRPGNCYASMLSPIAGFQVRGAIWHQGYNNALQADGHVAYRQIFPKMIDAWRAAFNDPELAFGIISLCTAGPPQTMENYLERMVDEGIYIRAVQYQTFRDLAAAGDKTIGFASSYDMRRSWYHPGIKIPVGERMARWALATQYGQRVEWQPPELVEVKAAEGELHLVFNTSVNAEKDSPMLGFAIAGEDRRFQPAAASHLVTGKDNRNRPQYDRKVVVLTSPLVTAPTQFRYAWGRNPMGNVTRGIIPLATQRSDSWNIGEVPLVHEADMDHRAKVNENRKALRQADLARRLYEANALIGAQGQQ